jgi:nucleoside-diphosphate-sugar epimerase
VLITGGAGYVGSVLVPHLLRQGHAVRVLDLLLYGRESLAPLEGNSRLELIAGDLRDVDLVRQATTDCDAVIHLACISNDPSFELDPTLGKSINYDAFGPLVQAAKQSGVRRFIYASSSSVYGVKQTEHVTEDLPLEPLTDYSRYKALCEDILLAEQNERFAPLVLRPATVCGDSPRLRLDLTVNILTAHALKNGRITVHGGKQRRPNIHIRDMVELYAQALIWPEEKIAGRIYNAGYQNHRVEEIAKIVRDVVSRRFSGRRVEIVTTPTVDHRSYHISSELLRRELGFAPRHTIQDAVNDLVTAFQAGRVPDALTDPRYYNIQRMQQVQEQRSLYDSYAA